MTEEQSRREFEAEWDNVLFPGDDEAKDMAWQMWQAATTLALKGRVMLPEDPTGNVSREYAQGWVDYGETLKQINGWLLTPSPAVAVSEEREWKSITDTDLHDPDATKKTPEVFITCAKCGHENYLRTQAPAAAPVRLPEPKKEIEIHEELNFIDRAIAWNNEGWNACLEEIAKLNGVEK